MATGTRRRGRILALQALYEADTSSHLPEEALERLVAEKSQPATAAEFARKLVRGVREHRGAIDQVIAKAAPQWPVAEVAVIDRTILRIAIYEVLFDNETPVRVAVSEAVGLAKTFGSDGSTRFVNGVLGTVAARATR